MDLGFLNVFGGNADPFRALGPDGKPITQIGQSGFQATPMQGMPQADYGSAINQTMGNAQQNYNRQGDYINMLQGQANGQGPSVAQELLRQQTQANNQNAASAIASQRGMNPGLAAKMILDQQANQQQQAAGQGSLLRANEMMGARGMLGSAIGQQGAQNLGMFGQAGGLQQGQNTLNLANWQGAQGLNAQTAGLNAQLQNQGLGMNAGAYSQNADTSGKVMGGLLQGLGAVGAAYAGKAHGGMIPGRASVPGDSERNDKVRALLSPGEVVLPRSVASDPEKAAAFVRHLREHEKKGDGKEKGASLDHLHKRVSHLEQMLCGGGRAA